MFQAVARWCLVENQRVRKRSKRSVALAFRASQDLRRSSLHPRAVAGLVGWKSHGCKPDGLRPAECPSSVRATAPGGDRAAPPPPPPAIRRGWVWPMVPRYAAAEFRQIFGQPVVVLPEPVPRRRRRTHLVCLCDGPLAIARPRRSLTGRSGIGYRGNGGLRRFANEPFGPRRTESAGPARSFLAPRWGAAPGF